MRRDDIECTCDEQTEADEHPCPFAQEIHDNDEPCTCCEHCTHECAMDV